MSNARFGLRVRNGLVRGITEGLQFVDDDALAFITAAAITNQNDQSAINTLVAELKTFGLWTKMKAIYPFVGGTSAAHKFNLKDPRDLDAAFRLVFNGGWTHSANGATPNGTNGYADTRLVPSSVLTNNNYHLSHYSRTQNILGNKVDIGSQGPLPTMISLSQYYGSLSVKGFVCGDYNTVDIRFNNTDTLGLHVGSRTSQTSAKMFMDGVQIGATLTISNPNALPTSNIFIGATGNGATGQEFSDRQVAFSSIGDGLTDTEAANLYTAVQTFQTTLGRQV